MKSIMLTDSELICLYQSGDENALKTLILRYEQKVFTYIVTSVKNRELAEDIFQDTFVKVINKLRSGAYKDEGKFYQWVLRIANNLKIDYFRQTQRLPVYDNNGDFDIFETLGMEDASAEDKMIREQLFEEVCGLVKFLPQEQREVLEMRIYQDISFKEIAELTHVSINTALGRMRYALINLRKMIEENQMVLS